VIEYQAPVLGRCSLQQDGLFRAVGDISALQRFFSCDFLDLETAAESRSEAADGAAVR
jgi:hypothetical protein